MPRTLWTRSQPERELIKLNKRTIRVLVVITLILVGVGLITHVSKVRRTTQYLQDLALQDPDKVMEAMTQLRSDGASVGPRVAELVQAGDANAAPRAAWLLGLVGSHAGDQALTSALTSPNTTLRVAALQSLGQLRVASAQPAVAAVLADATQKPEVRASAAYALGMMGLPASAGALAKALSERPAPVPPVAPAPVAPAATAPAAPVAPVAKPAAAPAPAPKVAEAAKPAAPAVPAPAAKPAAPPPPPPDTTISLRLAAAQALGKLGAPEGAAALAETLKPEVEPNAEVRVAAAYALGDLAAVLNDQPSGRTAASGLLQGLTDKVGDVRIASAYAIGKVTLPGDMEPAVKAALKSASEDKHYWTRLAVQQSHGELKLRD